MNNKLKAEMDKIEKAKGVGEAIWMIGMLIFTAGGIVALVSKVGAPIAFTGIGILLLSDIPKWWAKRL